MIEVRQIDAHADGSTNGTNGDSLPKPRQLMFADGIHQPGYNQEEYDEQIIIGHLHVVRIDLKGREHSRQQQAPQVFPPKGKHDTGNERRQISQGPHLPYMTCGNNNQEIGREGPDNTSQRRQLLTEVEGPQQDVESQEIGKHIPHVLRQPEVIGIGGLRQYVR